MFESGWNCTGAPSVCVWYSLCGDGIISGKETCDDGNNLWYDGCDAQCEVESGWTCSGAPSVCNEICGDGLHMGGVACDDGNIINSDGCSSTCFIETGF